MQVGDYIRVIDRYQNHVTRWGGLEGRIVEIDLTGSGRESVRVRTHLHREFTVPVSQCKEIEP